MRCLKRTEFSSVLGFADICIDSAELFSVPSLGISGLNCMGVESLIPVFATLCDSETSEQQQLVSELCPVSIEDGKCTFFKREGEKDLITHKPP